MKRLISLMLCAIMLLAFAACTPNTETSQGGTESSSSGETNVSNGGDVTEEGYVKDGELKVRHFKCGKADAILIRTKTHTFLIDTGEADDSQDILDYLAEKGIKKLDYILLSTYDKDCYGGAAAIIRSVEVDNVIMPAYEKDTVEYAELMDEIKKTDIVLKRLSAKMTIELDDATLELEGSRYERYIQRQDENASIIVSLTHGDVKMLFASSIQSERMYEMLNSGELGKYDYLKVPNFGLVNNNTAAFIAAVSPKIASISCSDKNPPDQQTLDALQTAGTTVYLTKNGNVKLTSDGKAIEVKQ
ncbi:MAG: MBL fold metallo-hydrolase [Clostridia bacterium]|nr:MBL fold metallo-hydrolase [Clostridia bacterium]